MKFAFAVLCTLALALGVQSSVIPWGPQVVGGGLSYTAVSPSVVASPWSPWGATWGAPWAPSVAVHAAPIAVAAGEGSYVAQTRGAVHTAPLAGHLNSVANINVAPAPGTW